MYVNGANFFYFMYVYKDQYFFVVQSLSHVQLFATPWTVTHKAPVFMEFSRQEYWSRLPCPPPGDLPDLGLNPCLLHFLLGILILLSHLGSPDTSILHPKCPVLLISMFSALILATGRSFSSLLPTPVLFVGGVCCWGPGLALGSMDFSREILLCGSGQVLYSQANQGDPVTASPLHMRPWRLW